MQNADIGTIKSRRPASSARLELVTASGTDMPPSIHEGFHAQPTHRAPDTFAWEVFSSFGPAGNALHASGFDAPAGSAMSIDAQEPHPAIPSNKSLLPSIVTEIVGRYHRWRKERRIRAQIAYYMHLPDWVLRDIGLQRDQIVYAVRLEHGEIAPAPAAE